MRKKIALTSYKVFKMRLLFELLLILFLIDSNKARTTQFCEDTYPIENEEWTVFLQKTIEEVMSGEMTSLSQPNLANIVVSPLRNCNCNCKVIALAANLLSLPFVTNGITEDCLEKIKNVTKSVLKTLDIILLIVLDVFGC